MAPKVVLPDDSPDLDALDVSVFQRISGFTVRFEDDGPSGKYVVLLDDTGARLAGFPWPAAYLSDLIACVRDSTLEAPYHEMDQSWEILAWRKGADFFLLHGGGEPFGEFDVALRVPADAFLAAWIAAGRRRQLGAL